MEVPGKQGLCWKRKVIRGVRVPGQQGVTSRGAPIHLCVQHSLRVDVNQCHLGSCWENQI